MTINKENAKINLTDEVFGFINQDFDALDTLKYVSAKLEGALELARDLNILTAVEFLNNVALLRKATNIKIDKIVLG